MYKTKDKDFFLAVFLIIFSVGGIYLSLKIPNDSFGLSPNFFPIMLFGIVGASSVGLLFQSMKNPNKQPFKIVINKKVAAMTVLLAVYVVMFSTISFIPATFIFILASMLLFDERKPIKIILVPTISTAIIYFIFVYIFRAAIV